MQLLLVAHFKNCRIFSPIPIEWVFDHTHGPKCILYIPKWNHGLKITLPIYQSRSTLVPNGYFVY